MPDYKYGSVVEVPPEVLDGFVSNMKMMSEEWAKHLTVKAICALCKKPMAVNDTVVYHGLVLHTRCEKTVRRRLEQFIRILFDSPDDETFVKSLEASTST